MEIKDKIKLNKVTHSVRASQAVLQYGVGAMVDFPEQTLMTAAPETWDNSIVEIHDERLEKVLHVGYFGMPGSSDELKYQNGLSYARFPEWYFCPKCRRFKPLKEWIKEYSSNPKTKKSYEKDPYMAKRLRCPVCFQDLVVARIVVACGQGHIDDFPWIKWVHAKNFAGSRKVCEHPELKFTTSASSTEGLEGLTVSCVTCNCRTTLKGAFDKGALETLDKKTRGDYDFRCSGRHPWKNSKEVCGEYPHVLQRGSSSVYFPVTMSSLVIPPYSSMLTGRIQNSNAFADLRKAIATAIKTVSSIPGMKVTQEMKDSIIKENIKEYGKKISLEIGKKEDQVRSVLERRWREPDDPGYTTTSIKYRAEEYVALSGEVSAEDKSGDFVREDTDINDYNIPFVKAISLIHKVREVQALVGYSRLEPVDSDSISNNGKIAVVDVKEKDTNWYPGYEVRGEGIFIEFDEDAIDNWRTNNDVLLNRIALINDNYKKSYYGSMKERDISSKFVFLHTISHLLMKQLSFECGYNIASIKERIYCSEPSEGRAMSGVFIYTASGDSEGTMGGLVRQGRPDVFPAIFKKAIESAVACSNDPVCSLSQGQGRDSLNLAACYSCSLVPETSCEEFNVFLDRGTIVGTYEYPEMGMYSELLTKKKNWVSLARKKANSKAIQNNNAQERKCIITDYGMELAGTSYLDIWKSMLQFADGEKEKALLHDLVDHASEFSEKEIPWSNAAFNIGNDRNLSVNLMWPKSKVMLFAMENETEYMSAKDSDWKCIFSGDNGISYKTVLGALKER